ncbi:hypothetical protein MAPG_00965 [Magnaporthiopsis poae ATCC 64411]|uniref:Secreted protein n=1 Tax=Magnaporthiopsis poae (strain ATCC 64411 / 73-15) TaxID=644358 RepID=A0A0C4DMF8_MAGP6|nr:hypothetical protein MAPG_00965 [Magnaporthiopsis poae ATCC 64411]
MRHGLRSCLLFSFRFFFLLACQRPFSPRIALLPPSWVGLHGLAAMAQSLSISHHHHHHCHHHLACGCPLQTRLTHHHVHRRPSIPPSLITSCTLKPTGEFSRSIINRVPSETIRPAQNSFQLTERSSDDQLSRPCACPLIFFFLSYFSFSFFFYPLYSPHAFFFFFVYSPSSLLLLPPEGKPLSLSGTLGTLGLGDGLG